MSSAHPKVFLQILEHLLAFAKRVRMTLVVGRLKRKLGSGKMFISHAVSSAVLERDGLLQPPQALLLPLKGHHHLLVAHLVAARVVGFRDLNLEPSVSGELPEICT